MRTEAFNTWKALESIRESRSVQNVEEPLSTVDEVRFNRFGYEIAIAAQQRCDDLLVFAD